MEILYLGLLPSAASMILCSDIVKNATDGYLDQREQAFTALPGGMPLMVYLMCVCHAVSQVSPTHICLVVAADYFHVTLGDLVRKTLSVSLAFILLVTVYYNVLLLL